MAEQQASWRIQDIWNEKLRVNDTEYLPRNYIRASEIGYPMLDRYYRMKGVAPTNPFSDRVLRIFDAGRLFEWLVEKVFMEAGILVETQKELTIPATDKLLEVRGHFDHKVGGNVEWGVARERVKDEQFPEWIEERALKLISELEQKYPKGLREIIAEIKSINSMSFWAHKKRDRDGMFKGYDHHKLQLFTYLTADDMVEGRLFYVSKDDLTLEEVPVFRTPHLKEMWDADITAMSNYYLTNTEPPKEDYIVFNNETGKFESNWRVGRSNYLTKITGFEDEAAWKESIKEEVQARNKELKNGKSK